MRTRLPALLLALAVAPWPTAQDATLLTDDSAIHTVAGPMMYTEGPAALPDGRILFTEAGPAHTVHAYDPATGQDAIFFTKEQSGGANGLFVAHGKLYVCEDRINRLVSVWDLEVGDDGTLRPTNRTLLADTFDGQRLNAPNDLTVDAQGGVYFTDPKYGKHDFTLDVEGVYYRAADGTLTRIIEDYQRPNGIVLSLDGKTLYVADNHAQKIYAYDVAGPGQIQNKRLLIDVAEYGGPDGMTVDAAGRVYVAIYDGHLLAVNPDGSLVMHLQPGTRTSNACFAPDGKTLYFTSENQLKTITLSDEALGPALQ